MRNDRVTVETLSGKNSPQKNEFHSKTAFFDLFAWQVDSNAIVRK